MNSLVSIGLPIYNRPEGLRKTLECFINQTYKNIEIIIADNCSPNPEVERIAKEYCEKDSRISYYRHAENKGWGFNTNFVIQKANGAFFMRATDDDWWDSTFIEKMIVQFNNNNKLVLSSSNFQFVDEFGKEVWSYNVKDHYQYLLEFVSNNQILNLRNYINQFEGFGKSSLYLGLYKSKVLKEKFVYETIKNEDLEGDLIINLFCLLKGELALNSECLIHFTVGNPKFYTNEVVKTKLINLIFLKINYLKINTLFNKWNGYFSKMRKIIINSELPIYLRVYLITLIFRRRLLFYYDLVTCNIDSWPFNIFYRIKRKFTLE